MRTHLVEELKEVHIRRVGAEVLLEQPVDGGLEDERVVDRNHPHVRRAVPARLPAPRDRRVHDVVRHEEERLKLATHVRASPHEKPETLRTSSTHHPNTAALKYSSSVNARPLRISTESTTERPRLSLPPGTL